MSKASSAPKVYVDTCVFLNVIKREAGLWPDSLKILRAAERGDIRLIASTLLMTEIASWNGEVDPITRDKVLSDYLEKLAGRMGGARPFSSLTMRESYVIATGCGAPTPRISQRPSGARPII